VRPARHLHFRSKCLRARFTVCGPHVRWANPPQYQFFEWLPVSDNAISRPQGATGLRANAKTTSRLRLDGVVPLRQRFGALES
jgi:hypothetical protein